MNRQWIKQTGIVIPAALCLIGIATLANRAKATGAITKADLSGPWQASLVSSGGGCGVGTEVVTFTLSASGTSSNAVETAHNSGCGDATLTGQSFTITSLNSNGSGTAGLTCGPGCGFSFAIQVSADRSTFSLVDISDQGQFQGGMAIHQ